MRLDIVTNDAGELVRREHARELGAGVVVAIYRLAKLAQLHDLTNQAFLRQLDEAHALIQDYALRSGSDLNILFAKRAIFVAGQLLKGSRGTYDSASELGEILEWCGGAELTVLRDVSKDDLRSFAEAISSAMRGERGKFRSPSARIRLRKVNDAARLRGLELEELSLEQRIVRAYASAVVIMRRFFEDLAAGRYVLPRRVKRIAQSLVDLSEGSTPAFLGVTEARNANHDEAGRAVNSAILAVAIAREITDERAQLVQIAMAAIMHDVGRPRAIALAASQGPSLGAVAAKLSEDAEDKLAAGTAAVLTALGRVNEATITRTVVSYEALWTRRAGYLGPVYRGVRAPTLHARVVAIARRYNDLVTPEPGLAPPLPDAAIAQLFDELKLPADRVVLRMMVAALGLYPVGTIVQLTTKEVGEVVSSNDGQAKLGKPRVRVVLDAKGGSLDRPYEIDLASAPKRGAPPMAIERVVSVDGWRKGRELALDSGVRAASRESAQRSEPPPARTSEAPLAGVDSPPPEPEPAALVHDDEERPSGVSLGTSPSAVAEAFGRHMTEPPVPLRASVAPPTTRNPAAAPRSDRTAVQPSPFGDAAIGFVAPPGARDAITDRAPSAKGTIAATPLVHVLVYILDHMLSGSVIFREPDGGESYVYFDAGAPAKARVRGAVALLGDELASAGAIDRGAIEDTVAGAQRLGVLLGEYLVGNKMVAPEVLAQALSEQLKKKLASLANLPPETTYVFYRDVNALEPFAAGTLTPCHPLDAVLECARQWHDRARVHATLGRLGKQPLDLYADVDLSPLSLRDEEAVVLAIIRAERPTLPQLLQMNITDEDVVGSLVYTLAVTRQFAFSRGAPMGRARTASIAAPRDPLLMQAIVEPCAPPSSRDAPAPASSRDRELRAMNDLRGAENALAEGDRKRALELATRAYEADPRPEHAALLAWVRAARGAQPSAVADAIADLTELLDATPGLERALVYRGKLFKRANRIKEALGDFEMILARSPGHVEAASEARLLRARLGKK